MRRIATAALHTAIVAMMLVSCTKSAPPAPGANSSSRVASTTATPATTALDASSATAAQPTAAPALDESIYASGRLRTARSIGHTSVVYKLRFTGPTRAVDAAWKPKSRRGGVRFRGEIAAYKLALWLGLQAHVPPAYGAMLAKHDVERALVDEASRTIFGDETVVESHLAIIVSPGEPTEIVPTTAIAGALIPWIVDLKFPALEREPELSRWKRALRNQSTWSDVSTDDKALAEQMSAGCTLDFLTANFDRFSGGNIGQVGATLLFIDNDGAFLDPTPPAALKDNLARIGEIDRFSRSLVTALGGITRDRARELLGGATSYSLSDKQVDAMVQRSLNLQSLIRTKIEKWGEAAVLVFP